MFSFLGFVHYIFSVSPDDRMVWRQDLNCKVLKALCERHRQWGDRELVRLILKQGWGLTYARIIDQSKFGRLLLRLFGLGFCQKPVIILFVILAERKARGG